MDINEKVLQLFEENKYAEALGLLEQAVIEERTVQSLNNLAWMYVFEEEDHDRTVYKGSKVIEKLGENSGFGRLGENVQLERMSENEKEESNLYW